MNYKLQYYGVRDEPYNGRILDISVPGHFGTDLDMSVLGTGHFGTDLDISVLGTGQFGTWMRQYSVLTTIVWYLLIVNIFVLVVL
jgi:hypothetical protein